MVDRQFEALRRERQRLAEDPNSGKSPAKPEEHDLPVANVATANGATEATLSEQEVNNKKNHLVLITKIALENLVRF